LLSLEYEISNLRAAGIDLEVVTAEPGGDEAVKARLEERGVTNLSFPVLSDPEHKLLVLDAGDVYVTAHYDWKVSGNYEMIQPALIVFDVQQGKLIPECTWSWKTMGYGDNDELDKIFDASINAEVALVTLRPVISDLVNSIKERRPVKLTTTHKNVADILEDDD